MKVFEDIEKKIDAFKEEFAKEFVTRVKRRTPVKTGRLQGGWTAEVAEDIVIRNDVPYMPYVEYGTRYMPPRGMLRQTNEEAEQIAQQAARKVNL